MTYDYVKRAYAFQPEIGRRIQHTVTGRFGVIARENRSQGHYVQVKFDGQSFALPCHPDEIRYAEAEAGATP